MVGAKKTTLRAAYRPQILTANDGKGTVHTTTGELGVVVRTTGDAR
jgi:hypothetical protein